MEESQPCLPLEFYLLDILPPFTYAGLQTNGDYLDSGGCSQTQLGHHPSPHIPILPAAHLNTMSAGLGKVSGDPDNDDYVAQVLAREARDSSVKYSTVGMEAYRSPRYEYLYWNIIFSESNE